MKFPTTDGINLNYTDEGDGSPVLLIAGHTAPLSSWTLLKDALVTAGHRAVSLDRRHTGASDFPDAGMRMARQGADIHEFLNGVALDRPILVASSLGVSATLAMIDVFGTSAIGGLVLVDQTPRMINEDGWDLGMYDLTRDTLEEFLPMFGSAEWMTGSRFRRPNTIAPSPAVLPLLIESMQTPYPHDQVRALLRDHALQDWRDVLPRIDVPTLVVGGRHSELWPVEHAEYMAAQIPNAELRVFEGSGHAPMWTEPDAFNETVVAFAAEVPS